MILDLGTGSDPAGFLQSKGKKRVNFHRVESSIDKHLLHRGRRLRQQSAAIKSKAQNSLAQNLPLQLGAFVLTELDMVGLNSPRGLFQPKQFSDSVSVVKQLSAATQKVVGRWGLVSSPSSL